MTSKGVCVFSILTHDASEAPCSFYSVSSSQKVDNKINTYVNIYTNLERYTSLFT